MRDNLEPSLRLVFGSEGGYWNDPSGGPTKFGITAATLAAHRGVKSVAPSGVQALELSEAADIYRAGYWSQSGGDLLPVGLDYAAFDFGVNSGPARAVRTLQRVLGVAEDGNIGPQTAAAARAYPGGLEKLIRDYCEARMVFLRSLKARKTGFPANGRGWTIRVTGVDPAGAYAPVAGVVGNALAMARGGAAPPTPIRTISAAKTPEPVPNPWAKPETVLQGMAALGGLSFLFTGSGPVQIAIGGAVGVAALCGAFVFVRRVRAG